MISGIDNHINRLNLFAGGLLEAGHNPHIFLSIFQIGVSLQSVSLLQAATPNTHVLAN